MPTYLSLLINDQQWEVRRFSGDFYHRRTGSGVWLPGVPPDSTAEQLHKAFARLELRPGSQSLRDTDRDQPHTPKRKKKR